MSERIAYENIDFLLQCGYTKPVQKITIADRVDLVNIVSLQVVILSMLGELSEFRRGLNTLGVADAMEKFPHLLRGFYSIDAKESLTSGESPIC